MLRLLVQRSFASAPPKTSAAAVGKIKEGAGELGQIGYQKACDVAKVGQKKAVEAKGEAMDSARKKLEEAQRTGGGMLKRARQLLSEKLAGK